MTIILTDTGVVRTLEGLLNYFTNERAALIYCKLEGITEFRIEDVSVDVADFRTLRKKTE